MIPKDTAAPINQCLIQASSEKPPLAIERNQHRDPQQHNMQRMRDPGTASPEWDVFIKPLFSGIIEFAEEEVERL